MTSSTGSLPWFRTIPRRTADVAAVATGIVVAGITAVALTHPQLGLHVVDGVAMLAALLGAGVAVFRAFLGRSVGVAPDRQICRAIRTAAVVGGIAALLTLPFDVMTVAGDGVRGLASSVARSDVLAGSDYEAVLARLAGLMLLAWTATRTSSPRSRVTRFGAAAGALVVTASFVLTGHARSHSGDILAPLFTAAHVLAAGTWLGGLVALWLVLGSDDSDSAATLRIFARTMTVVLTTLVVAGAGLTWRYLPTLSALVTTTYGAVLLVKLAVLSGVVIVSAANHYRLVPLATSGDARARALLRLNVTVEQCGLVAIVFITEVLMRQNSGA